MSFYCNVCCIHTKSQKNLNIHFSSVRHKLREQNKQNEIHHLCVCGKSFTKASNLSRHRKKCNMIIQSEKSSQFQSLIHENNQMKEEMNVLRKQIEMLLEKNGGNTTHNTTTNSNNTIDNGTHFNITVNSFGNENIDYLTDKIVCRLIQTAPFASVPQLIEKIHFDPDHPENHNIKITNKKMNYAEIIKNNKWVTANKKQVIDNVIQNSYYLLDEKFIDNKDTMTQKRQERFENFQEKFQEEDEEIMKNIKNQVDLVLINGTNNVHK